MNKTFKTVFLLFFFLLSVSAGIAQAMREIRTLLVFFDGLRPEYITPEIMPNVYAFSREASNGKNHHSVIPTVTRVNASSYSSGSYPATHGVMGNTIYLATVKKDKGISTSDYEVMNAANETLGGKLLTSITLGEILQESGERMMVFSSGSTGQAFLQNHTISGGAIVNPELIFPESIRATVTTEIGPPPDESKSKTAGHTWITDALVKYGLRMDGPLVSAIWYSDPDGTAHSDGIGAPTTLTAIHAVDHEFGRILKALNQNGLDKNFNIIISADHGFITHKGKTGLGQFLISKGLMKSEPNEDIVVADGAIYVKNHELPVIKKIVETLQQQDWVGPIFTKAKKPGDIKGTVAGTLSFESIHWNHERAGDILVFSNWNDERNDYGFAGMDFIGGVAGHGGVSPYEIHIALIASGPSFKNGFESQLPTSNVDIVPTVLYVQGLTIPPSMEGRVWKELLVEKSENETQSPIIKTVSTKTKINGGRYSITLQQTLLGKYMYVDFGKAERKASKAKR